MLYLLLLLGGPVQSEHVEAELVARHASAQPGSTLTVGLRLKLEKTWHVYWRNPGNSGDRVYLTWTLPEGVTAGPIQWPFPARIPMPGEIMNYGYEGELVFPVEISVPAGYAAPSLALEARAEWLVCDDNMCLPADIRLTLDVPVTAAAPGADTRWEKLFAAADARLPRAAPEGALRAHGGGGTVTLEADVEGKTLEFFPFDGKQIVLSAEQERTDRGLELEAQTGVERLTGILVVDRARAVRVDVAIGKAPAAPPWLWIGGALVLGAAFLIVRRRRA